MIELEKKEKELELEYLEKTIKKLRHQANMHYIFLAIGLFVSLIGILYLAINPDIIIGSLCFIIIGIGIIIYNLLLRKQKLKRASELEIDLKKEQNI